MRGPMRAVEVFPINRRHQGLATISLIFSMKRFLSFQSIGVTKDWRLYQGICKRLGIRPKFPINRRHQGLATSLYIYNAAEAKGRFPINRRHQGLATSIVSSNRNYGGRFPINRRHQGLATGLSDSSFYVQQGASFQSIGVTKDWRLSVKF